MEKSGEGRQEGRPREWGIPATAARAKGGRPRLQAKGTREGEAGGAGGKEGPGRLPDTGPSVAATDKVGKSRVSSLRW